MAGHHLGAACGGLIGQEVEGEAFRAFIPSLDREFQAKQGIKQAVLGGFELTPGQQVLRLREVRNGAVVTAGDAVRVRPVGRHEPVARVVGGVGAKAVRTARLRERAPCVAFRLKGRERVRFRQIAESVRTALARRVLEVEKLPAMLALEQLHGSNLWERRAREGFRLNARRRLSA
jgi:hypothetical protein